MMRFSERLKEVLTREGWNQKKLAKLSGVDSSNVSRWQRGVALPDKEALEKLIRVVSDHDAARLLMAWIAESLPARADELIIVQPRDLNSNVAEPEKEGWPTELSSESKRMFVDFAKLAMNNRDVMQVVEVLHKAATRKGAAKR